MTISLWLEACQFGLPYRSHLSFYLFLQFLYSSFLCGQWALPTPSPHSATGLVSLPLFPHYYGFNLLSSNMRSDTASLVAAHKSWHAEFVFKWHFIQDSLYPFVRNMLGVWRCPSMLLMSVSMSLSPDCAIWQCFLQLCWGLFHEPSPNAAPAGWSVHQGSDGRAARWSHVSCRLHATFLLSLCAGKLSTHHFFFLLLCVSLLSLTSGLMLLWGIWMASTRKSSWWHRLCNCETALHPRKALVLRWTSLLSLWPLHFHCCQHRIP